MNTTNITIEQIESFLKDAKQLEITTGSTIDEKYQWIQRILTTTRYLHLKRKERSLVRQFLIRCTGYGMSHTDHLIAEFRHIGRIIRKKRDNGGEFSTFYTTRDTTLLAEVSEAYFHPNGKALKAILHDMYHVYDDDQFERLSRLSVSRLYDFRKTVLYQNAILTYTKTRPTATPVGERKKPYPEGKPGYLLVDSVHQGDLDKEKGVYHIHLVMK